MTHPRRMLLLIAAILVYAASSMASSGPEPKPSGGKCSVAFPGV